MGLNIYFYRKDRKGKSIDVEEAKQQIGDALLGVSPKLVKRLIKHSNGTGKSIAECLEEALEEYLDYEGDSYSNGDEVGRVFGMWSLVCMFKDVTESCQKRTLTQSEIKNLHKLIEKTMYDVERHFQDKGYSIVHSPFEDGEESLIIAKDGVRKEVIVRLAAFEEKDEDHSLEYEANDVCGNTFYYFSERFELEDGKSIGGNKTYDRWIYRKLIKLYGIFQDIIQNTDFKKQKIVMEASW